MAEPNLSLIKSNVAKMVTAGAPESDIDAYVAGEGTSAEALRATSSAMSFGGAAKAAGRGLVDAATGIVGLPGVLQNVVNAGMNKVAGPMTPESQAEMERIRQPDPSDLEKKIEGVTGPMYEPQNKGEEYIRSVAGMVPGLALGPGGVARRAISQVAIPGVAAQAAGDIPGVKGTAAEPYVRAAAAVASPIAAERMATPLTTAPTRAAAVANLRNEGVDVSAGQSTGSKTLRKAEGELGGSSAQALAERQGEQFTAAVMRRVGENAPRATPEVIDGAFTRIGGDMNRLAAANAVTSDAALTNALRHAENEYNRLVAPNARAPVVQETLDDINHLFQNGGTMGGDVYQSLRSRLGADARSIKTDPRLQSTIYDIQHALDDAMERAIQRQNPADVGAWRDARTQYRNLLAVEKAVNSAGEAAASGLITPQNLARGVKQVQGQRDYSRGRNDLAVLARNGSEVMAPLANSETASRSRIYQMLAIPGSVIGGGAAMHGGLGPEATIAAAVTGAAVPRAAGEALIRGRRYLGNSAIQDRQGAVENIARAYLGSRKSGLQ